MEITADQLTALMAVISHATQTIGWVVGIAVTLFLACFGGAMALIFKQNAERITEIENKAEHAGKEAEKVRDEVTVHAAQCASMRAGCREQFLTRYVTDSEMKDMEKEFKELVQDVLRRLEGQLSENRTTLLSALHDVKADIAGAVVNHQHDGNGSVLIRRSNGGIR